jgi:hypothetical protein
MKPEIAKKWIAALRSGKYMQTTGRLRDGNSFCCLGVLCNLHAQEHPRFAAKQGDPHRYGGEYYNPPPAVWRWAGISCTKVSEAPSFAHLNDSGESFASIAKAIKKWAHTL